MQPFFAQTKAAVAAVQQASNIGGLPANIENDITTVRDDISPARIGVLQTTLDSRRTCSRSSGTTRPTSTT